jgi:1-acyl-sn-glycerol-3-phosphate acyltransferase
MAGKNINPDKSRLVPAWWAYWPLAGLVALILRLIFFLRVKVDREVRKLKGPLIMIGNHPSYLDPLIMAATLLPKRIRFVTSRDFFRGRFLAWLLCQLGAIPKTQFRTDTQSIKAILQTIRSSGSIAVFPEGQRSIDGRLQPFDDSMAKLIKKAACPVILVMQYGAYLAWPRWSASGMRPGRIDVKATVMLSAAEIKRMNVNQIQRRLIRAMSYNDYESQKTRLYRYRSFSPAAGMDRILHQCPACLKELAMQSDRRTLTCRFCVNRALIKPTGLIEPDLALDPEQAAKIRVYPDLATWHAWQIDNIQKEIQSGSFLRSYPAQMSLPEEDGEDQAQAGILQLDASQLLFFKDESSQQAGRAELAIPLANRSGVSASFGKHFEIAYADKTYRFTPEPGQAVVILVDILRAL